MVRSLIPQEAGVINDPSGVDGHGGIHCIRPGVARRTINQPVEAVHLRDGF